MLPPLGKHSHTPSTLDGVFPSMQLDVFESVPLTFLCAEIRSKSAMKLSPACRDSRRQYRAGNLSGSRAAGRRPVPGLMEWGDWLEFEMDSIRKFQKPADDELKKKLTPEQYRVTQHEATERPFTNEYNDNHEAGIYVDVVSGEPLFSSLDKFDAHCGWPSFSKPLDESGVTTRVDHKLGMPRTEVRSAQADSHLGHVFDDGPGPTGLRYCMNSASMRFVPVAELAEEGYGEWLKLFDGDRKV